MAKYTIQIEVEGDGAELNPSELRDASFTLANAFREAASGGDKVKAAPKLVRETKKS